MTTGRMSPTRFVRGGLKTAGGRFDLAHDAKDVSIGNLPDVVVAVAAAQELGDELRVAGHVLEADDNGSDAVEVPAEPDVFDARDLPDVVDVIGDLRQRGAWRRIEPPPVDHRGVHGGLVVVER